MGYAGRVVLQRANEEEQRRIQLEKERDEAANVARHQLEMVHQREKQLVGGFRCFKLPPDNERTASFQNSLRNQQKDEANPQHSVTATIPECNYYNNNCIQNNNSTRTTMMQQFTNTNSYHAE